jgi:hypothetical protein
MLHLPQNELLFFSLLGSHYLLHCAILTIRVLVITVVCLKRVLFKLATLHYPEVPTAFYLSVSPVFLMRNNLLDTKVLSDNSEREGVYLKRPGRVFAVV